MDNGIFSVGIDWKYEGKSYELDNSDEDDEYLVLPRYNSLKEEMLNYKYLSFRKYKKIIKKGKQCVQTHIAKSMIYSDKEISLDALICIIMYCDYTELSQNFTSSFRKTNEFELIHHIKKRNSKYFHWSKILKTTITRYGQCYSKNTISNCALGRLCGPFYCGINIILNISQFYMYTYGPLSTSVHLEVAMKFSGAEGMILEMDNETGNCVWLHGMNCSWISRYKEEDERLFFGCHHSLRPIAINISSIRIIETATNYRDTIQAITLFDNIISNNIEKKVSQKLISNSVVIMSDLIEVGNSDEFDPFIYNSWRIFLQKKNCIEIDMDLLLMYISDFRYLGIIFGGRGFIITIKDDADDNYVIPDDHDMTNILKLNLFNNLQTVNIKNVQYRNGYHSFSLYQLLSILALSKIQKVEISIPARYTAVDRSSWLSYLWSKESLSLIKQYRNKEYVIEFVNDHRGHSILITLS